MSFCRINGCTTDGQSICSGGTGVIEWICEPHRRVCSCYQCRKYRATTNREGELDTDYKKAILCPHCGEECNDEYDSKYWSEASKGDQFEIECDHCEMKFYVDPHVEIHYSTTKKDCDHTSGYRRRCTDLHGGVTERCKSCGAKRPEEEDGQDQVS